MKKNQLMAFVLGLSGIFAVSAKEFNINIANKSLGDEATFVLHVTTVETHSSMCGLQLSSLTMTNPAMDFTQEIAPVKELQLTFSSNPRAMCMMAFGPHRGAAQLAIGNSLPALSGIYNLTINGENYGILRVSQEEGATLEPATEVQE